MTFLFISIHATQLLPMPIVQRSFRVGRVYYSVIVAIFSSVLLDTKIRGVVFYVLWQSDRLSLGAVVFLRSSDTTVNFDATNAYLLP